MTVGLCVGAVVGSFAATAGLRLVGGLNPLAGRSQCDGCARPLGWSETLPFAGFAMAGGQCRACGSRIDLFHLAGEAIGAVVLAACLLMLQGLPAILTSGLCLLMLVSALIDLKTLRLPDLLTAGIAFCGLGLAFLSGHLISGLFVAVLSGAALYAVKWRLERRHDKPMLGFGDIKLIAALALWLGLRTPATLALAAILGLIIVLVTKRKEALPFGPMIAAASFIVGVLIPEGWLV
ncbi:MAG TPA: A24 family peptidase [Asticcacaulis sp.]|nr:A24 family peptidase [Asticcacaulis sp.]